MIYLTDGNIPLNAAYDDDIVQEANSTYQLSFKFPTNNILWQKLREETFLTADDLHGEQDFVIFEVEKKYGYIQVYANQVFTLLNNYVVNPISLDRQTGSTALSRFAGSITRDNPFSFFSDIDDRHTFNINSKNAMDAFAKDKHSILGLWGGDLVRHGYQVRLLKNGGSENESLFMYKKNLSSYEHKTSTKSLRTRITFITTIRGEGENPVDKHYKVVVDSPLINKYSQIYEDVVEVNDQDVKDEATLLKYGKQYFRTTLCDMLEDSIEIDVIGHSDVPVQMFDVVGVYHEYYDLDVRKKISKYNYSPMAKRLKSIGFGEFKSGLASAIGNVVNDAVKDETRAFETRLNQEIKNADLAFDRKKEELVNQFTDGLNAAKARAEEAKRQLSDAIDQRFTSFYNGPLQEAKRRADEALRNAGASSLLAQEAKRIGLDSVARLEAFKRQATSAQTALSGDLDVLKRTIANDIRPKQEQVTAEIAKQVEALIQTKKELAGVKSAQATYEETMTRRLSELTNLANGKASKSELTQTAEQLASKIASVRVGGVNLFKGSKDFSGSWVNLGNWTRESEKYQGMTVMSRVGTWFGISQAFETQKGEVYTLSFYIKSSIDRDRINVYFTHASTNQLARTLPYMSSVAISNEWQRTSVTFEITESGFILPRIERFNTEAPVYVAGLKLERGNISTDYSEAPEDIEGQISIVESSFRQRADALDAGVSRLTEGLTTKADISALNVTAENIRQSVKSLEKDTQNKMNQKLNLAEFEVRAGSIRQEILNATKDKADKTLVIAEAGKLREEFSKMKVGSRNYAEDYDFSRGLWRYHQGDSSPVDWKIINGEYHVKGTTKIWKQMQIFSKEGSRVSEKNSTALLELEIGETYTLSFQGICYSGSSNVWISLRANRTTPSNPEIINGNFNLTSSWQTYQVTIPALTKPDNFDFWRIILGYNEIGHVAFRKVELTRSSTRIDAGPAPEDSKTDLVIAKSEFQKTAEGLSTKLAAVETYVNQDSQRQEALRRYTREESAKQATAVRELVSRDFVGKASYQEDVRGFERRFEAITNPKNGSIATQIANYKQSVDGRFTDITSLISGKANQADFQRVKETSQLYERILGNTDNGIANNVARMALTNQLFQVEVAKAAKGGRNYIRNGQFKNGSKNWLEHQSVDFGLNFNYQHSQNPNNRNRPGLHFYHESQDVANFFGIRQSIAFDGVRGEKVTVSLLVSKDGGDANSGLKVALHYIKNKDIVGQEWQSIPSPQITSKYKRFTFTFTLSDDVENLNLMLYGEKGKTINLYVTDVQLERGSVATDYTEAPEDTDEAIRSVQTQLNGSWSVQNITSAGAIISQINATNNQILIEAEKIRLKGKTLLDELTAIQGYFKRLFVGEGAFATLNTDILRANSITADKLVMDIAMARRFVSSDIFTDTLAAKEAFINKLRSVVVTATLLEGYKGRIGGFQIGTHEKDSSVYWITGQNQFSVGMSNGSGQWSQTALWVNWGNNWAYPGDYAWYVKNNGKMYCYNTAEFWNTPVIHGNLRVTGHIYYNNENSGKSGYWIHSSKYSNFEPSDNYLYLYYSGSGYDWIPMNKEISDRRYKHNIEDSTVSGLDVIQKLKTYSYRKEYDGKIEDIACGIMAQDVQKHAPEAFFENPDGAYSYNTFALVPYLIKAIQELNQKIEKLEKTA